MSAVGSPPLHAGSPEIMNKILLRSSTPASNEKVLLYLEGMNTDPPDPDESDYLPHQSPRSQHNHPSRVASPLLKSTLSAGRQGLRTARSGRSELSYVTDKRNNGVAGDAKSARNDDVRSDIQEGRESDLGTTVPIRTTNHVEPGPEDGPGIRYESLGSSFGNFGQPPWDNHQGTPAKAAGVPLPASAPPSNHPSEVNPFQQFGMTPLAAVGMSSRPVNGGGRVESPVNGSKGLLASPGTRVSQQKSLPPSNDLHNQPRSPSRVGKTPSNEEKTDRPMSPRSGASHAQSAKSRTAQRSQATGRHSAEDQVDEESGLGPLRTITMQKSRSHAHSKASSLAPSDSPSVAGQKYAYVGGMASNKEPSVKSPRTPQPPLMTNGDHHENRSAGFMSPKSQRSRALSPNGNKLAHEDLVQVAAGLSPRAQQNYLHGLQKGNSRDPDDTPTQSRPHSPSNDLDEEEQEMVRTVLSKTPRTSYAASALETDVQNSHFHDMELCELLHSLDNHALSEVVKKAVRKAVRARVKKLGMKSDNESIRKYRKSFHDHDPRVHLQPNFVPTLSQTLSQSPEPPDWARELMDGMMHMQQRLDVMAPKIELLKLSRTGSIVSSRHPHSRHYTAASELDQNGETPRAQTIPIYTQPTGTIADESTFQQDTMILEPTTIPASTRETIPEDEGFDDEEHHYMHQDMVEHTLGLQDDFMAGARNDSPGRQFLEEELYKLRVKTGGSQSAVGTHKTWEVAREDANYDYEPQQAVTESGMPEIPDTTNHTYTEHRQPSPSLPPIPHSENGGEMVHMPEANNLWHNGYGELQTPPWQRIHQRLLNWAIIWPMSELEQALISTTRGHQVDEIALSIWSTQSYKRYVRSKMTDSPPGRVDRLFVPPNVADAISTAVFNGRHGDACMMLRDLWAPFGLDGIPRLLIVLAKHRTDDSHWVVHRFSLPDGQLTTYDTYPEKCLPDGRPLGWWFAIRIAWPDANYPSPDNLMQKMVRLHRPLQLGIDNSVAAAGIWRNLLMGSRAERSVDLERLRDLINTEVKNLRQRKQMGKLSIGQPKPAWEDMN